MKKILIIGCSGSGKSTLTRMLAKKYNLPAVHLDQYFWKAGWVQAPVEEFRTNVQKLADQDEWIMDGTYTNTFDLRFPAADQIIILNMPRLTCLYRIFFRTLKYNKTNRPDMTSGCDERFNFEFFKYIWNYNKKVLPRVEVAIDNYGSREKVVYLLTAKEVDDFLRL